MSGSEASMLLTVSSTPVADQTKPWCLAMLGRIDAAADAGRITMSQYRLMAAPIEARLQEFEPDVA